MYYLSKLFVFPALLLATSVFASPMATPDSNDLEGWVGDVSSLGLPGLPSTMSVESTASEEFTDSIALRLAPPVFDILPIVFLDSQYSDTHFICNCITVTTPPPIVIIPLPDDPAAVASPSAFLLTGLGLVLVRLSQRTRNA